MRASTSLLSLSFFSGIALASVLAESPTPAKEAPAVSPQYPARYLTAFEAVHGPAMSRLGLITETYLNATAQTVGDLSMLPYPYGSVIAFEWTEPVKDAEGKLLKDAEGRPLKGKVTRIDVMEREPGFGKEYRSHPVGEWEFASFRPDGSRMILKDAGDSCAACHSRAASRDFVFAGRFPQLKPNP